MARIRNIRPGRGHRVLSCTHIHNIIKQGISGGDHNIMWDPSDDWDINHIVKQIATLKG